MGHLLNIWERLGNFFGTLWVQHPPCIWHWLFLCWTLTLAVPFLDIDTGCAFAGHWHWLYLCLTMPGRVLTLAVPLLDIDIGCAIAGHRLAMSGHFVRTGTDAETWAIRTCCRDAHQWRKTEGSAVSVKKCVRQAWRQWLWGVYMSPAMFQLTQAAHFPGPSLYTEQLYAGRLFKKKPNWTHKLAWNHRKEQLFLCRAGYQEECTQSGLLFK